MWLSSSKRRFCRSKIQPLGCARAYDTNGIVALVEELGAAVVIPSKNNRLVQRVIDRNLYRDRNNVAHFFSRLKQFRRLATRYDKTACSFLGMLHFVSALLWLR